MEVELSKKLKKLKEEEKLDKIEYFISCLFNTYVQTHIFHLQVPYFAVHIALNDLYNFMPSFIDSIVENYQGKYNIINNYNLENIKNYENEEQIIVYLENLLNYIEKYSIIIFKDSDMLNLIDNLKNEIKSCLYKIKHLS